jgi:hypothetical protein
LTRAATVEDLLTKKKPAERKVELILDGELAERWHEAKTVALLAKLEKERNTNPQTTSALEEAEEAVDALRPEVEEATVQLTLKAMGRRQYEALMDEHRPTKDQRAKARKQGVDLVFNEDTFPVALIAASLVSPKMTEDEVAEMAESEAFNAAEWHLLTRTAMDLNQQTKVVALGKGFDT